MLIIHNQRQVLHIQATIEDIPYPVILPNGVYCHTELFEGTKSLVQSFVMIVCGV